MNKLTWVKPTISKVAVKSVTRGPGGVGGDFLGQTATS